MIFEDGVNVPKERSPTYDRMLKGLIRLSPYSTWRIRLIPLNNVTGFQPLQLFKDCDITLSLTGTGTYIVKELALNQELNLALDEFYEQDETMNEIEERRNSLIPVLPGDYPVFQQLQDLVGGDELLTRAIGKSLRKKQRKITKKKIPRKPAVVS